MESKLKEPKATSATKSSAESSGPMSDDIINPRPLTTKCARLWQVVTDCTGRAPYAETEQKAWAGVSGGNIHRILPVILNSNLCKYEEFRS
jgi:hypothetical protein